MSEINPTLALVILLALAGLAVYGAYALMRDLNNLARGYRIRIERTADHPSKRY